MGVYLSVFYFPATVSGFVILFLVYCPTPEIWCTSMLSYKV